MYNRNRFLLVAFLMLLACSPSKIIVDHSSEHSVLELNREMEIKKTIIYLKDGRILRKGDFELVSDSLFQAIEKDTIAYSITEINSIKTVGNHSSTTIISLMAIGAGVAILATTPKDYSDQYPTPHSIEESRSESLSDTFKENFLGSLLTIFGIIMLIGGIRQVTTLYEIR